MRHCLMRDLQDDPALIDEYEQQHRAIWPEVAAHLRAQGVRDMQIYRLGTRLCMVMETDDAIFTFERMAQAVAANPRLVAWEQAMLRCFAPTSWTPEGVKWVPAKRIFDLALQG